jgi:hypothetical protein
METGVRLDNELPTQLFQNSLVRVAAYAFGPGQGLSTSRIHICCRCRVLVGLIVS